MLRICIALVLLSCLLPSADPADVVPTRVTIDEHNRLILNGMPWFPLALSPGPPVGAKDPEGRDAFDTIHAAGMNAFRVGLQWDEAGIVERARYMDTAARHGMYCFINLREYTVFDPQYPERREKLRTVVDQYRCHPALAMWKTMDEPINVPPYPADQMREAYLYLKQLDPDHPAWLNHAARSTGPQITPYLSACDVTGFDVYPISYPKGKGTHLANREISAVGEHALRMGMCTEFAKPIVMVLQISWSGATPPNNRLIFPTFGEERYMAYQSIIDGARGLMFFGGNLNLSNDDAQLGFNWTFWREVLRPLMAEIGEGTELHQALLAPISTVRLTVSGASDIEYTAREVGPWLYILAAKREGPESRVRFSGDLPAGEADVMFENRSIRVTGGTFADTFAPNDVHIYKIRLNHGGRQIRNSKYEARNKRQ